MPFFVKPQVQPEGMQISNAKNWDRKEKGAGGYAVFRKTPNTDGGYADFKFRKGDMKETGAGGYAIF